MACKVTITSVVGVPIGPPAQPGSISALTISGTATNTPTVSVICECFGDDTARPVPVVNGLWQITGAVPRLDRSVTLCNCGETVSVFVEATDPSDGTNCGTEFQGAISCPPCPSITIDPPVVGDCVNGVRPVTLTVNVNQAAGATSVLEWDFGDPSPDNGGAFVIVGPGSNTTTPHNYRPPGPYTATLKTVSPQGCPDITVPITVEPCPCPEIQDITFSDGPCDVQGNQLVTATLVGGPAGTILWQWMGIDPLAVPGQGVTYTRSLPGGTTNTLVVSVQGPCTQQLSKPHTLQPCPGPPVCPSVTSITATPPSGSVPLTVTFTAVIANPGAVVGGFLWKFSDGGSVNTANPTVSHTFSSAGTFSVSLTVNGPAPECTPSTLTTTVTVSSGGCNLLCKILCVILLIVALLLLALASVASVIVFCRATPPTPQAIAPAIIAAALGLGLLLLWGFLCGRFFCKTLNALSWIFSFIISITALVGIILTVYAWITGRSSLCFIGWFADAGIWGVALAIVGWISKITGCQIFD